MNRMGCGADGEPQNDEQGSPNGEVKGSPTLSPVVLSASSFGIRPLHDWRLIPHNDLHPLLFAERSKTAVPISSCSFKEFSPRGCQPFDFTMHLAPICRHFRLLHGSRVSGRWGDSLYSKGREECAATRYPHNASGRMIHQTRLPLSTQGYRHMQDITQAVAEIVIRSGVKTGIVHLFNIGSTAAWARLSSSRVAGRLPGVARSPDSTELRLRSRANVA